MKFCNKNYNLMFVTVPLALIAPAAMGQHFPGRPAQHQPPVYVYCYSSGQKLYFSNIFTLPANQVRSAGNAFTDFLKGQYGSATASGVSCTPNNTEQLAKDGKERIRTAFLRAQDQNHQTGSVIETAWTYPGAVAPGAATPAPATTPPPAAPPQPAPAARPPSPVAATAGSSDATAITGVYVGTYKCSGQNRDLQLSVHGESDGTLSATFSFRPKPNGDFASFKMAGQYNGDKKHVTLQPVSWETAAPPGFVMVGLDGSYIPASHMLSGVIHYGSCSGFSTTLDTSQSPKF